MKALVTGARGFIGSFLVEKLLEQGHEVRCLLRRKSGHSWLDGLDFETVQGDITQAASLETAVQNVDVVFHLAGCTKALNRAGFYRVNVDGTRNLLEATAKYNPQLSRFVHVSSLAAAGPTRNGRPLLESEKPFPVSNYGKSKLESEHVAQEFCADLPITIVRPPAVYGPRDRDVFDFFKQAKLGIRPVLGGGARSASFIYVKDLVDGLLLAADKKGAIGQTYFLCDDAPYTWDELGSCIDAALNVTTRRIVLPLSLAFLVCVGVELFSQITRKPGLLNLDKYREIKMNHWVCSNGKARQELGFVPGFSLQAGIQEAGQWYLQQGWL